jgi:signal transduction histidine kinase
MRYRSPFKSIYARFAMIFIGIWWLLNALTFGVMMRLLSGSILISFPQVLLKFKDEMRMVREMTGLVFLLSTLLGTVLILLAVRGIVRPIRKLSLASKEIARGDFDIELQPASRDEIGQLIADFNHMARSLKGIDLLRKDFVANVSHEFKTPITAIRGYARLISDGGLDSGQLREYGQMIADESQRLALLSASLLRLSELDSQMIVEQEAFSLDEQIRKAVLLLEIQWSKKEICFDLDLVPISIMASAHLLQEVWLNLIDNAIKFSPYGSEIRIALTRQEGFALVEVTDHGTGIKPEDKPHIFERFFKGDKARSQEGNGLGLVIARKIVESSGGTLTFSSEWGQGSTFTVKLTLSG